MTASVEETSPPAITPSIPRVVTRAGSKTTRPTRAAMTPIVAASAGSKPPAPTKDVAETIPLPSGRDQTSQPPMMLSAPKQDPAAGINTSPQANDAPAPILEAPAGSLLALIDEAVEADPAFLALAADLVDDLEQVRIANENRLRHLTRDRADSDGEVRGLGLDARHPYVRRFQKVVDELKTAEHDAVLGLQGLMRKHPLGPWVKTTIGVGEKQAARLLAVIGDPYWNPLHDRPRTVSELWAFCGYHVLPARQGNRDTHATFAGGSKTGHPGHNSPDAQGVSAGVAPKRQRGQRANWSTTAKVRTYLIAESCIKQRTSPFRTVYDATRAKYADATHDVPCVRCGPSGQPAPAGSALSDGHKHARAMRAVSKEILKELWRASRDLHLNTPPADHCEGSTSC